jgi:hypothetical protein
MIPLVFSNRTHNAFGSYVHSARFAILWRLKHSVALDSQGRQIYDEVTLAVFFNSAFVRTAFGSQSD